MEFASDEYECIGCAKKFSWEKLIQTMTGSLFCSECWETLHNEPVRNCPVDGSVMKKKLVLDAFMIDQCQRCGGTWFDQGELRVVQQAAKDAGKDEAVGGNFFHLLGLV